VSKSRKAERMLRSRNVCPFLRLNVDIGTHVITGKTKAQKRAEKEKAAKADDPKAGADVGKIVNLMAGDANRVRRRTIDVFQNPIVLIQISQMISGAYFIYGGLSFPCSSFPESYHIHSTAPFEIIIAGTFLYQ